MDILSNGQSEYYGQEFKNLNYTQYTIQDKEFIDCTFIKCSFTEMAFSNCKFSDCTFKDCDLQIVRVEGCTFIKTSFENSRVIGVVWPDANWERASLLSTIDFTDCVLNYSSFATLKLKEIKLKDCIAKEVDLTETDLTKADCRGTDFTQSRFYHTNLTGADFTGAKNYSINAGQNTLEKTRFSLPEAMSLLHSLDIILDE